MDKCICGGESRISKILYTKTGCFLYDIIKRVNIKECKKKTGHHDIHEYKMIKLIINFLLLSFLEQSRQI